MKPSATQQPLVVLLLRDGDVPDLAAALEGEGAVVLRADSLDAAREMMDTRDSDLFVIAAENPGLCAAAREAAHGAGYRPPIIVANQHLDDLAVDQLAGSDRDTYVRSFDGLPDLARAWITVGRMHRKVRRYDREMPARVEEMDDLRRFTEELVATLPSKLVIVDEDLKVLYANRTALESSNVDARTVVGRPVAQLVPITADGGAFAEAVRRVLDVGGPVRLQSLRVPVPGDPSGERIVNADIRPCSLADVRCARVMLDDVTEEWNSEQGRRREARKLQDVVDAIGAGLATLDHNLRITWANRAFAQWFAQPAGRHCNEVWGRPASECVDCPARRALQGAGSQAETWHASVAGGGQRALQCTFVSVTESDGSRSLIVFVLDVTEQADRLEQVQMVEHVGEALGGVLELDELLQLILTCVTTGHAFGFNRAFLFLRNRHAHTLDGRIAVGPASAEEAGRIWGELAARQKSLEDALRDAAAQPPSTPPLLSLIENLRYSLDDEREILVRVFKERKAVVVKDTGTDGRVTGDFRTRFGASEFVAVPLISKGRSLGVVLADNLYNRRPITERDRALLQMFASTAGLAIENAEAFADLKESINTLRSTRRQLVDQTKLAAVGRVAAHIAHEIRNPLATIGGFAHSIENHPDKADRVKTSAGIIYEEVMRLERMLSGIMDFSRPTRPVPVQQSLNTIVERAIPTLAQQVPEGVSVTADLDPALADISFDAEQIRQVLINLVRNAGEAMRSEGGCVVISTRAHADGTMLSVSDTGAGIPAELRQKVFEPFFTTKKGGTGLGLAVSRHIIVEHGGAMRIDSAPGAGTTVGCILPAEPPPPTEKLTEEEELP